MVQGHFNALVFITQQEKAPIIPLFIKAINAVVLKQTGNIYQTVFGELDAAKGVFRKGNVSAGNSYFVSYQKVPGLVEKLCDGINEKLSTANTIIEKLNSCFDAHFDLVTIHPFYDGNGTTSRLLRGATTNKEKRKPANFQEIYVRTVCIGRKLVTSQNF